MGLTNNQQKLLNSLKKEACKLGDEGQSLTGLIGELYACDIQNMRWSPSKGYDCIDEESRKVQVKSRRDSKGGKVNKQGRLGRFGKSGKYNFDYGLYVELDGNFEVSAIYRATRKEIIEIEKNEKSNRGLHVSTFLKVAKKLYPQES